MARPTEPGYYWLECRGGWEIALVDNFRKVHRMYGGRELDLDRLADSQWGGKITQEPAPGPPPPF